MYIRFVNTDSHDREDDLVVKVLDLSFSRFKEVCIEFISSISEYDLITYNETTRESLLQKIKQIKKDDKDVYEKLYESVSCIDSQSGNRDFIDFATKKGYFENIEEVIIDY